MQPFLLRLYFVTKTNYPQERVLVQKKVRLVNALTSLRNWRVFEPVNKKEISSVDLRGRVIPSTYGNY